MMGSETFIMVAFRCAENRTPSSLARTTWAARNSSSAAARITVPSMTSPPSTGKAFFRTLTEPSSRTSWRAMVPSDPMTTDFSFARKSSAVMWATLVLESADQAPMECGFWRA
ncbi:hypothetical protein AHiyo4_12660 [Arthrobacter sp. Hiyo4]|nr:hypothetical protein AHiyo4_12660 [Arthrobacter sp. Hiyo4]